MGGNPKTKLQVVCESSAVLEEWNELVMLATSIEKTDMPDMGDVWSSLEECHIAMWKSEKAQYQKDVKEITNLHINSLQAGFNVKLRSIEQRIGDATDESLRRMFQSQLEAERERQNKQIEELRRKEMLADIQATIVANGIIIIE